MKKTEKLTYIPLNPLVSNIQIVLVRPRPDDTLAGFVSIRYRDELDLADLALHIGPKDGQFDVRYPLKPLYGGARVGVIRPVTKEVSDSIRDAIVDHYLALVRKHPHYKERL